MNTITKTHRLLLLVDCQNDFIEGGILAVNGALSAMEHLAEYIKNNNGKYELKVATIDWHPINHCSFKENGGEWPIHCLQYTVGAALNPMILDALYATEGKTVCLTKGTNIDDEEYSIFKNLDSTYELCKLIKNNNITHIDICGIAGDICVLNTLKDALKYCPNCKFNVLLPFCPSIDGGKALHEFVNSKNLNFIE